MNMRPIPRFLLKVVAVAMLGGPLVSACGGDAVDPAGSDTPGPGGDTDTGHNDDTTPDPGDTGDAGDRDTTLPDGGPGPDPDGGPDPVPDGGPDPVPDGGPDPVPDGGPDPTDTDQDVPDTPPGEFVCGEDEFFSGQVFGERTPNGGAPVFITNASEIDYPDGGLGALLEAAPSGAVDDRDPVTVDLVVTDARVIGTDFYSDTVAIPRSQTTFWVADESGTIELRLFRDGLGDDDYPLFDVRVGQRISFRATELSQYFGTKQVTRATDFELLESDDEVFILERTGGNITVDDIGKLVRVTGEVVGGGEGCGGTSLCWDLDYGGDDVIEFRAGNSLRGMEVGVCMTYTGIVGLFSGQPQLNPVNFGWVYIYRTDD